MIRIREPGSWSHGLNFAPPLQQAATPTGPGLPLTRTQRKLLPCGFATPWRSPARCAPETEREASVEPVRQSSKAVRNTDTAPSRNPGSVEVEVAEHVVNPVLVDAGDQALVVVRLP
jgi:hypothetical protein